MSIPYCKSINYYYIKNAERETVFSKDIISLNSKMGIVCEDSGFDNYDSFLGVRNCDIDIQLYPGE